MSRTLYLPSSGAPAISPAFDAAWWDTSSADRIAAVWDVPSATAFASLTVSSPALPDPSTLPTYQYSYLNTVLARQYVSPPIFSSWASTTAFVVGQIVTGAGHSQQVTVAGTSGGSAPSWNTSGGNTTDGTVTWVDIGSGPLTASYVTGFVRALRSVTGGQPGFPYGTTTAAPVICKIVNSAGTTLYKTHNLYYTPVNPHYLPSGFPDNGYMSISGVLSPATFSGNPFNSSKSNLTISAGDRLVIEVGYAIQQSNLYPQVTAADGTFEFGDAAAANLSYLGPNLQLNPIFVLGTPGGSAPPPPTPPPGGTGQWLVINEPTIGYTDQTFRLDGSGDGGNFQLMLRQRGTAEIPLRVDAGDSYEPTLGTQVFLYDVAPTGSTLVYVGTIDNIELSWDGVAGFRRYVCTCVSLEQCLDAIEVPPQSFLNTAAGTIVTTLFNALMAGAPITLGTISAGTSIPSLVISDYPTLSSIIDQLATTCGFIWGVDPASQQLFFQLPSLSAAPFTLATAQIQWESMKWSQNRSDFRDRQINQISQDAFANSSELFTGTGSASTFTLREKPNQVISAWVTQNTQNSATCTFTGLPSNGDTATVSYPAGGSTYNWAALAPYTTGQIIIDPAGHVQKVTTGGTSGASQPTWNDSGSTTVDGSVIWTDQGISGGGNFADQVYTFVTTLDNTLWGQVLIGATAAQTASNFSKAINAHESDRGVLYSMPTWENSLLNAGTASGGTFTVRNKSAGAGYIAALSESAANFTWSAALTSGGTTTFGTEVLQVAVEGTSNTANLYYTPGSTSVKLASVPGGPSLPISSSWRLQVEYTRLGADCIAVEDTALVTTRAAIENGTGKYQKKLTNTGVTSAPTGLLQAQQALAAYSTLPVSFTFDTWVSGLTPGQYLAISVSDLPVGIAALINGNWLIQEVRGRLENAYPYMDPDGFPASVTGVGHYQYTVTVINTSVIGDYLEFWQGMSSGSGGSGSNVVIAGAFPAGSSGGGGTGTVTSVALSAPTQFSVGGSPVTTSGTLALSWVSQNANKILAGPTTGAAAAPTFRSLVAADLSGLCVTSVAMTVPTGELAVSGSPITGSGTLAVTWATQVRNLVLASAVSGGLATPSFRSLVVADIPSIDLSGGTGNGVTGNLGTNHLAGGTGASSATFWRGDGVWAAPSTSGLLVATNNLSDLTNTASARANLGLGSAAQNNTSDFLSSGTGVSDSFNPTFVTFMQFVDGQLISYS